MLNKTELCKKIRSMYPDIGECGIDLNVNYDDTEKAWEVDLKKDHHQLKTYLEPADADMCMTGKQCIGLGMQISQLRSNIAQM